VIFSKASVELVKLKNWVTLLFTNPVEYQKIIDAKAKPLVPYLNHDLQNLLPIIEKEPTFIPGSGSVINFMKCIKLFHILKHLRDLQLNKYNLLPIYQIYVFFDGFPEYTEQKKV